MPVIEELQNLIALKKFEEGLELARSSILTEGSSSKLNILIAQILVEIGQPSEALVHLEIASKGIQPNSIDDSLSIAKVMLSCGGDSSAVHLLSRLREALDLSQASFTQLQSLIDLHLIMEAPEMALEILSSVYHFYERGEEFLPFLILLGKVFQHAEKPWDEIEVYLLALKINPLSTKVHHALSKSLSRVSLSDAASDHLKFIDKIDPDFKRTAIALDYFNACRAGSFELQEKLKQQWINSPSLEQTTQAPFAALVATDDPEFILHQNQMFSENLYLDKRKGRSAIIPIDFAAEKRRIKVCYISPDFGNHPVCHLMTDLVAKHDRTIFEITGISIAHPNNSVYRDKIKSNFDHFLEFEEESTANIAKFIRNQKTDIVVDLAGHTKGSRSTLFNRLENVAIVNYLGYPSTTGHNQYHYILGDHIVTPPEHDQFFTETVIRLDCCYQANSPSRSVEEVPFDQTGLPADSFVFCNFNTRQKLNIETLEAWAKILWQCCDGVLWILDPGETIQREILKTLPGLEHRIFFAPKLSVEQHLGRLQHSNVFIDNFPYGAHTTASDAIFRGVPVISRSGRAFQSRVSRSIMAHAGMSELDADTWTDFVELACHYYDTYSQESGHAIALKLQDWNKKGHPYNVEYTTRCVEQAFLDIVTE